MGSFVNALVMRSLRNSEKEVSHERHDLLEKMQEGALRAARDEQLIKEVLRRKDLLKNLVEYYTNHSKSNSSKCFRPKKAPARA